jgi:transcriptional regulator with GAF, ATPase, and Fis domain
MRQPQKPTAAEQQILSLGRILERLREEDNVEVLIEITISYLKEQFDYNLIWLALYDRLNHILIGKGGVTPVSDSSQLRQKVVLSPGDLLEQVVIQQVPLGIPDLRGDNRVEGWQEIAKKFNIQGTIILPIRHKDRCWGIILLGYQRWGYLLAGEAKARLMMVVNELGAVLNQIEINLQQKQTKHADEQLLDLLENLRTLTNLQQKLEAVVHATHQFVLPTRTNIYWFERERRYFWLRLSNQLTNVTQARGDRQVPPGITVQELSDFYYALSVNEIVCIGEGRSSLKTDFTAKLLRRLQLRSLLAAPIICHNDLVGFLALEAKDARIWTQSDKNFLKGAAGLISLVASSDSMETTIRQMQDDVHITSQLAKALYSNYEVEEILHSCAVKVLERLGGTRFLLLYYDSEQNNYQLFYQSQLYGRRPLTFALDALKDVDWQLLQRSNSAVGIENLEEDLRFYNWCSPFLENGVRALLIGNCVQSHPPEILLVITTETNRCWITLEKDLLWAVSQQIGVIVRQWQLQHQTEQQQNVLHSFQQCFQILQQAQSVRPQSLRQFENSLLRQIALHLSCPLAILLSWETGQHIVEIISEEIAHSQFAITEDAVISVSTESLIQWALATDDPLIIRVDDLPKATRNWLNGPSTGQVLVMALHTTTAYQPTGVVIIADDSQRQWPEQILKATETLVRQLAWSRHQNHITQILESTTAELRQLNWYKHRRLEDIQRTVMLLIGQMHSLGVPTNELSYMRYQELLRQLDNTTTSVNALLKLEEWELDLSQETIAVASLLKRALERVEHLLTQRKLWVGVHGLGQQVIERETQNNFSVSSSSDSSSGSKPQAITIVCDIVKIELVLHELLVSACNRSIGLGRIDIWCQPLDENWVEVSITDNGIMEPQLLAELHQDTPKEALTSPTLSQPPGLHLLICQQLVQQLGGQLLFEQLTDGRVVSRLLLRLASYNR